jgi:acetyl esterase/lipase
MILEDSLSVYDFLTENLKIDPDNIFVFGRSIGSGPATYLCSQRKPATLILMSPFTSLRAVAQNIVGNIVKFLVSER